jgi:glycosyltransferase involved in cell wall biosynthesis
MMADDTPGITVLIATYNRAAVLSETLQALTRVERTGIDCSIVIVDNNSRDNTAEIVKEYGTRLPLSYLRESRPGKNCALNKALRECALKDIVVFTDDDVTPARNWLQEIFCSVNKWPGIGAFGGKVEVAWPDNKQPEWAMRDWMMGFGFTRHHYADGEAFYKPPACPFGPNYWVRKVVFQKVPFFDETIGPRPTNRIMGSETSFLMDLQQHGFPILYYPGAEVHHRILREACTVPWLRRRAYTYGRGRIRAYGWHRRSIYLKSRILWGVALVADEFYAALRFLTGFFLRDSRRNCERTVSAMIMFGQLHETLNEVLKRFKPNGRNVDAEWSKRMPAQASSNPERFAKLPYEKPD